MLTLDETGLSTNTLDEIAEDIGNRLKAKFGDNFDTNPTESLSGLATNVLSEFWSLGEQAALTLYRGIDPDSAIGVTLDARVALTGTTRDGATFSQVDVEFNFTGVDTVNDGDVFRLDDTQELFEAINGPYVSAGPSTIPGTLQAVNPGPKTAAAGSTWTIVTSIPNLGTVTNATDDADPGRNREDDEDLKRRRQDELYAQNLGGLLAISGFVQRTINETPGIGTVLSAVCYHNPDQNPVDSDGIPFKAFNLVLELSPAIPDAATQQAIWDAIWLATGAGGEAYGTDYVGTTTDSEGNAQPSAFDVVADVNMLVEIDLITSTTESKVSENIETVVAAQVLETAQALYEIAGRDVLSYDFTSIVQQMQAAGTISGVDGVVVRLAIDPAVPAVKTKESIGIRQKPDFDSANITVVQV